MQFSKITSTSKKSTSLGIMIKLVLIITVILVVVVMLSKVDFPSPNKLIEKTISNDKLKIVK